MGEDVPEQLEGPGGVARGDGHLGEGDESREADGVRAGPAPGGERGAGPLDRLAAPPRRGGEVSRKRAHVAHIVGPHATELIGQAAAFLRCEATTEEMVRTIHAHPTLTEALHEAAEAVDGHNIHG